MKKTITLAITAAMMLVMGITCFAAPTVPDIIPDGGLTMLDTILDIFREILGIIGTIAGMLFK